MQVGIEGGVLLALTPLLAVMTLSARRTTVLHGVVHLVILAAFLFFDRQASVKLTGGVGLLMAPKRLFT
jgi:hypothetical protein